MPSLQTKPVPETTTSPLPSPSPQSPPPPPIPGIPKADTSMSWGAPAGLHVRRNNDENLIIFRRAVGISGVTNTLTGTTFPISAVGGGGDIDVVKSLEEGRGYNNLKSGRGGRSLTWGRNYGYGTWGFPGRRIAGSNKAKASGMYAAVLQAQRSKRAGHVFISVLIYTSHFLQIILGASLTALGPTAGTYPALITLLGAINTVIAGILALIKGQGLAERLRHDQAEFRKLQDWIEQTEALLAVGVIGRNRTEVGLLVQVAFKKYNAAKASEENNVPENWVRATVVGDGIHGNGNVNGSGAVATAMAESSTHSSLSRGR